MKKLLTLLLLCFISTITFANKGFAINNNLNILSNEIKGSITLNNKFENIYEEVPFTCTATYTINIIDSETGRTIGVISRTASFTSDIATGTCGIAMAFAQRMAEDALEQWLLVD